MNGRNGRAVPRPRIGTRWRGWRTWVMWGAACVLVAGIKAFAAINVPLVLTGDSVEYAVNAIVVHDTGSCAHFNAWRMPGYSILLAALMRFGTLSTMVAALHATAGLATACLAGLVARRAIPGTSFAGPLVLLLVGLDPVGLMYERMLLTETICGFAFIFSVWLAVGAGSHPRWSGAAWRLALCGLVLALATLIRANVQVFAALVPSIAAAAWFLANRRAQSGPWAGRRAFARAALLALVAGGVVAACLVPRVLHIRRTDGQYTLAIGGDFTRMLGLADAGLIDLDNPAIFTQEQHRAVVERAAQPFFGGYELLEVLNTRSLLAHRFADLSPWAAANARAAVVVDHTVRKHRKETTRLRWRAFANLLGLRVRIAAAFKENVWWFRAFAVRAPGADPGPPTTWWNDPETFTHLERSRVAELAVRTRRPMEAWRQSDAASIFDWWFRTARNARPYLAVGWILGVAALIARRRWPTALLLATPLVHHAVIAFHLFSGIDRYAVPFYPAACVASVAGCWVAGEAFVERLRTSRLNRRPMCPLSPPKSDP